MKKIYSSTLCIIFSIAVLFAEAPTSLSIQGTALNESSGVLSMKLSNGAYELYTSLKSGDYSFSDASAQSGTITVDGNAPYYIRVDYSGASPSVTISKIAKVSLWAPWNQYAIGELIYSQNSTFKGEKFLSQKSLWGDNRYRIRVELDGGELLTYQPVSGSTDAIPNDETPQSYYDMYLGPNGQWPGGGMEYKIADKYYDTGKRFNVEVVLKSTESYTHKISDYIASLSVCDEMSIDGSALENGRVVFIQKESGVFEFVGGLKDGTFVISGTKGSDTYNYTLEDDKLIIGSAALNVTGELAAYYIKVDLISGSFVMSKVSSVSLFYSSSGYAASNAIPFAYISNGKYTSTATIVFPPASWDGSVTDERYKIKMDLEGGASVFWGSYNIDNQKPAEDSGDYYKLYSVNSSDYDYSFKFREDVNNKRCDFQIVFGTDGVVTHQYSIRDDTRIDDVLFNSVSIYPTIVYDDLFVSTKENGFSAELISSAGSILFLATTETNEMKISNINIPKGVYIVRIVRHDKTVCTQRIIKL